MQLEILESRTLLDAEGIHTDSEAFHQTDDACNKTDDIDIIPDGLETDLESKAVAILINSSADELEQASAPKKMREIDYENALNGLHAIDRSILDGVLAAAQGAGYAFASMLLAPTVISGSIGYEVGQLAGIYLLEDHICEYEDAACQAFVEDASASGCAFVGSMVGLTTSIMLPSYTMIGQLQYWKVITLFGASINVAFETRDVYFEERDSLLTKLTAFVTRPPKQSQDATS